MKLGNHAPNVALHLHTGESVPLADLYRGRIVVLFFYPKDGTSVCTKEACAFRDSYEKLTDAGATVIGVSSDSAERHERFADQHRLPFLLATDNGGVLRKAFGVPKTLGFLPGRTTYVIDRQGIIRAIFNAQFAAEAHVQAAIDAINALTSTAAR
jgi:peroxiredoxin Q/BCP